MFKAIVQCLVHNVMFVAVVLTIGVIGVATQENVIAERPAVEGSSAQAFDCQQVPAGQFPTSALVRKINGATVQVTRPALVSKAFDVALGERTWVGVSGIELCA